MKASKKRLPAITALVEDVGDLRAFGLVVDLQSVTAAAAVLGESKATTSRRLTRLEGLLGVSLLRRTSRSVTVTEQGRAYRQRIGEVLELLAHANAGVRSVNQAPAGDLRVGVSPSLTRFVAPLVTEYVERQPDVRVELLVAEQPPDLDLQEIDAAFGFHADRGADELATELVTVQLICVAAPKVHPRQRLHHPNELGKHKVITHVTSDERELAFVELTTGKASSVRLRSSISCASIDIVTELALQGAGIGIVPHLVAASELAAGRLVRVLPNHAVPWGSLYYRQRRMRNLPSKLVSFRDFSKQFAQRHALA